MSFEKFCAATFDRMERNLVERNELSFWGAARAVPPLLVTEKVPGNGTWIAKADIATGQQAGISLMLVHGELRVGSIIPKTLLDRDSADDMLTLSPDGISADCMRELEGAYLYDRSYQDDPFSARFLIEAYDCAHKSEAVALTMGALVSSTWKAAYAVISRHEQSGLPHPLMLVSPSPIPTDRLKRELHIAVLETSFISGLGHFAQVRSAVDERVLAAQIIEAGIHGIHVHTHDEGSHTHVPALA